MTLRTNPTRFAKLALTVALALASPMFLLAQKKTTSAPAPRSAPAKSSSAPARSSSGSSSRSSSSSSRSSSRTSSNTSRSSSRSSSNTRSSSHSSSKSSNSNSGQRRQHAQQVKQQQAQQRQQKKQQQEQAKAQQKQQKQAEKQRQQQAKDQAKQEKQQAKEQEKQRKQAEKQAKEQSKQQQKQAKNQPKQAASPTTASAASAGPRSVTSPAGHQMNYDNAGRLNTMTTNKGTVANFNAHGQVSNIHTTNGTMITRNSAGSRTVVSEHVGANGARYQVVSTGLHVGYVQRTTVVGGHQFVTRTYVGPGRTYVAVYRARFYGGMPYYAYVPGYYWGPGFYGWAYDPWYGPAYYSWGWYGDPWYASYGYYYAPYPVYPSAAFWLTDYLVSETLRSAYEARLSNEAAAADNAAIAADNSYAAAQSQPVAQNNNVVLTPEIKQMIADEVKVELAAERAEAANTANLTAPEAVSAEAPANAPVPPALDPNMRLFIVATAMEVAADGQACTLSPGDVVIRTENVADNMNTVAVNVISSQKNDCRMGSLPRLQVSDLQEMHNRFLEKMDGGLKTLAHNQGKNGLPGAPTVEGRANPYGTVAEEATAKAEIENQNAEADQAEKEVQQAAPAPKAPSGN